MTQLTELYKNVVLDHNRAPRHFGELEPPCTHLEAFNPLCGDKLTVFLRVTDSQIDRLTFTGVGCALSQASASMMTELMQGESIHAANRLAQRFVGQFDCNSDGLKVELPGDLPALLEARKFPSRVNCVLLGWHALMEHLQPLANDEE